MTLVAVLRCHPPVPDPGHLLPPAPVCSVHVLGTGAPGPQEAPQRTAWLLYGSLIYRPVPGSL